MRIILLGAPGTGKGTQANLIEKHFKIPKISTGDILRKEINKNTKIGINIKNKIKNGNLINNELILDLVKKEILNKKYKNGYIFDGFPRTLIQAKKINELGIKINYIINIKTSFNEIILRINGRRIHPKSGRIYHTIFNPPKKKDRDDLTNDLLIKRNDDKIDTIKKRLKIYKIQIKEIVKFYKNLNKKNNDINKNIPKYFCIYGNGNILDIHKKILNIIKLNNIFIK